MGWEYGGSGFRGEYEDPESKALTPAEVIATEVLSDRKYLVVFLKLGSGPKPSMALVESYVYARRGEEIAREKLPESTMYRVLKRLREAGLVKIGGGLDKRKKYYSLTPLGREVYDRVVDFLKAYFRRKARTTREEAKNLGRITGEELRKYPGYVLSPEEFKRLAIQELGLDPSLLREALDLEKLKVGSHEYYYLERERV